MSKPRHDGIAQGADMIARCGAKLASREGTCRHTAGWGTDHKGIGCCRKHAGNTRNHVQAARAEMARQAVTRFGLPLDVPPAEALLAAVHDANGIVEFLRWRIDELDSDALVGADGRPDPYVTLFGEWVDRKAKFAQTALSIGIDAARVRLAERQGEAMVAVVVAVIDGLGLDAAQRERARQLAGAELRRLGTGAE